MYFVFIENEIQHKMCGLQLNEHLEIYSYFITLQKKKDDLTVSLRRQKQKTKKVIVKYKKEIIR